MNLTPSQIRELATNPDEFHEKKRKSELHDFQRRQTESSERSAAEAKNANKIALEALKESNKARNEARLSYAIAGGSLLVTILALFF
jgi:hypothetical protein